MVGALNEPGMIAVWQVRDCAESERRLIEHELRNQQAVFAEVMEQFGCDDDSIILFEGWGSKTLGPAREVKRWLGDYALTWPWSPG